MSGMRVGHWVTWYCIEHTTCCGNGRKGFNSLAPGKFKWHFRYLIFQIISVIDGWGISCELALRWMSLDLTDDKSTLVQVIAWCRQAPSHYLSQWWTRSLSPYGVTRPQWVKITIYTPYLMCKLRESYSDFLRENQLSHKGPHCIAIHHHLLRM